MKIYWFIIPGERFALVEFYLEQFKKTRVWCCRKGEVRIKMQMQESNEWPESKLLLDNVNYSKKEKSNRLYKQKFKL